MILQVGNDSPEVVHSSPLKTQLRSRSFTEYMSFHFLLTLTSETNSKFALENWCLENEPFLLGCYLFRGKMLVSGEGMCIFLIRIPSGKLTTRHGKNLPIWWKTYRFDEKTYRFDGIYYLPGKDRGFPASELLVPRSVYQIIMSFLAHKNPWDERYIYLHLP